MQSVGNLISPFGRFVRIRVVRQNAVTMNSCVGIDKRFALCSVYHDSLVMYRQTKKRSKSATAKWGF